MSCTWLDDPLGWDFCGKPTIDGWHCEEHASPKPPEPFSTAHPTCPCLMCSSIYTECSGRDEDRGWPWYCAEHMPDQQIETYKVTKRRQRTENIKPLGYIRLPHGAGNERVARRISHQEMMERNQKILSMAENATVKLIAEEVGLSSARVYQILRQNAH
jgi:hypothetical protein